MILDSQKSGTGSFAYCNRAERLPDSHMKRDDLVSTMLQDRSVLRVISAPHGFGKTMLAREYANRLFPLDDVAWIRASDPDFLFALDEEENVHMKKHFNQMRLVVLDDMPWLHEQRAQKLSSFVDALLYDGIEVIVTTLPSCDCLETLEPDRLLIRAQDLLVSERECVLSLPTGDESRARGMRRWKEAKRLFLGFAPGMIWTDGTYSQKRLLAELFSERLPSTMVKAMCGMLFLGSGELDLLERLHVSLQSEDISLFMRDYPVFGIDAVANTFETGRCDLTALKEALVINELADTLITGEHSVVQRSLSVLFDSANTGRGVEVLDVFCSDDQCAAWFEERGWELLDRGEITLASSLLEKCPEGIYARSSAIRVLHAWLLGFLGDRREACHMSRRILAQEAPGKQEEGQARSRLLARLAIAAFEREDCLYRDRQSYSNGDSPVEALDFLACAVDACSPVEIARAFRFESALDDTAFEKERRPPSKQRVKTLLALFSEYHDRFHECTEYALALHLLAFVDNTELRRQLQELGCDLVLDMRRNGCLTFTQALLVRDLWRSGYFGLVGPVMDRRDVKVLDGASHMLSALARDCGFDTIDIPWESHASGYPGQGEAKVSAVKHDVECMHVRLFGALEVTVGDRYVTESGWRKKARALFAILVLNIGRDVPRDDIFQQIWPNSTRVHALDNFYALWSNCTSTVGGSPYIERNGEFCRVDPRYVTSDVAEFEKLTRHLLAADRDPNYLLDTYAKIEAIYRGPLMPSEGNVGVINAQRERYRALFVDAMVAATDCALRAYDTRVALWFARKAMEEDHTREDVYRALMKAQIAAGQRCPAIRTYFKCKDYLRSSLGLDPSVETRDLYDSLVMTDPGLLRLDSTSFTR